MLDLSTDICNYINKEWIAQWEGSIRSFAEEHGVDEKQSGKLLIQEIHLVELVCTPCTKCVWPEI